MSPEAVNAAFPNNGGWYEVWGRCFSPVTMAEGLPMVVGRRGHGPLGARVLHAATNPHSIHYEARLGVALDGGMPARMLRAHGAAAVTFDYLANDSRLLAAARGWAAVRPDDVVIAPHAVTPIADCGGSFDDWLARRSKRLRQRLRQVEQMASDEGLRCTFTTDDPVASGLLSRMLAVERSGWKGRARSAILDDPAATLFYTRLAERAAAAGAFRGASLWRDDRLVAFEYGLQSGTRVFMLKVGYDERFGELGLGHLLAARHIARCCADPTIDAYDKMGNGMTPAPYKARFADRNDLLYRVTIYAPGVRGRALRAYDRARAAAKAWRDRRRAAA